MKISIDMAESRASGLKDPRPKTYLSGIGGQVRLAIGADPMWPAWTFWKGAR